MSGRAILSAVIARQSPRCPSAAMRRWSMSTRPRHCAVSKLKSKARDRRATPNSPSRNALRASVKVPRRGGALMSSLGLGLARAALAAGLLVGSMAASQADGALAVGNCGAYGYAFDYRQID